MPFSIGIIALQDITDPNGVVATNVSGSELNNGGQANLGSTFQANIDNFETLTVDQNSLVDDFNNGSGSPGNILSSDLTLGGVTYTAGARVETDYSAVLQSSVTGLYYLVSNITIDDVVVGATISKPFDLTADGGNGAVVEGATYPANEQLVLVQPDGISNSAAWEAFVQDSTYNQGQGTDDAYSN
ncbi:MAG: hypothetical protein AAFO58_09480, partial [Pseudomonadota bacterium]